MDVIGDGPQAGNGEGFHFRLRQFFQLLIQLGLIQRDVHLAAGDDALPDSQATVRGHDHFSRRITEIPAVAVLLVPQPQFQRVFVARGHQQAGPGAVALYQCIQRNGAAVYQYRTASDEVRELQAGFTSQPSQSIQQHGDRIVPVGRGFKNQ